MSTKIRSNRTPSRPRVRFTTGARRFTRTSSRPPPRKPRPQTIIYQAVAPQSSPQPRKAIDQPDNLFSIVVNDISSVFSETAKHPAAIVFVVLIAALVMAHKDDITTTPFGRWITTKPQPAVANFIKENYQRLLAYAIFLPVLISVPDKHKVLVAACVLAWVSIVPEASYIEYTIQAVMLVVFMSCKHYYTKYVVVAFAIISFIMGWVVVGITPNSIVHPVTPKSTVDTTTPVIFPYVGGATPQLYEYNQGRYIPYIGSPDAATVNLFVQQLDGTFRNLPADVLAALQAQKRAAETPPPPTDPVPDPEPVKTRRRIMPPGPQNAEKTVS